MHHECDTHPTHQPTRRIIVIRHDHFARWLQLWELAVGETVRSEARTPLIAMAHRMAETMAPKAFGPSR